MGTVPFLDFRGLFQWPVVLLLGAVAFRPLLRASWGGTDASEWTFLETWDDDTNFVDNDAILFKDGLSSWNAHRSFWLTHRINVYEPLAWTLKAAVHDVFGLSPLAYRVCGLVLHLASAVIFRALLLRVLPLVINGACGPTNAPIAGTGENVSDQYHRAALLGSVGFAVHPLACEIVCWPSALPYALAGFFNVCALYCYARYGVKGVTIDDEVSVGDDEAAAAASASAAAAVDRREPTIITHHPSWLLCAVTCSMCSGLSKSAALLAAPAGFLAVDIMRGALRLDILSSRGRRRMLAYVFSADRALIAVSTLLLLAVTLWANTGGTENDIDTVTIDMRSRLLKAPILLLKTVRDTAWPAMLSPHYVWKDWLVEPSFSPMSVLSLGCVPAASFIAAAVSPLALAIWLWFVLTALPTLGLVQHGMVCLGGDRYAYLPLIPLFTFASMMFLRLEQHLQVSVLTTRHGADAVPTVQSNVLTSTCRHALLCSGAIAYLVSLGLVTHMNVPHWRNDETLWKWAIRTDPTDWRSTDQLVEHYIGKGDWAKATPLLPAIELFSPKAGLKAHLHRAKLLVMQSRTDEACTLYAALAEEESFRISPARGSIYNNNGVCSLHRNDQPGALQWFEEGLKQTKYDRHRRTLDSNMKELKKRWTHGQPQQQRYQGTHSLIF
jgi:hypothetical protein